MTNSTIRNKNSVLKRYRAVASSKIALAAIEAAIKAVEPVNLIFKAVSRHQDRLIVSDIRNRSLTLNLASFAEVHVVGAGKASVPMTIGLLRVLQQDRYTNLHISGSIVTPYGTSKSIHGVNVIEAGHPLPDLNSIKVTKKIVNILRRAKPSALVVVLLSGGGSALLSLPKRGITLADKRYVTQTLLSSGAAIQDLNVVRTHLSQVKGGRLIRYSHPSTTFLTLAISDVIGDEFQTIASGPTYPNYTSSIDAKRILLKYDIWNVDNSHVKRIKKVITNGIEVEKNEPQNISEYQRKLDFALIGNNAMACNAASQYLRSEKIDTLILGSHFDGDVAAHGRWLSLLANGLKSLSVSFAIVLGGETTVILDSQRKNGTGGRNQEAALHALLSLETASDQDISICCVGTDGIDGNSMAAGALVTGSMTSQCNFNSTEELRRYLQNHDSSTAFKKLGSQIITGKTLTNVNDVNVICRLTSRVSS